nr:response regulator [Variovorax boronicumulans]
MPQTRILYVEDNEDLRDSIAMLLEEEPGYAVQVCGTGEEALALLAQDGCDILISDVGLPGLSGVELAQQVLARNPAQYVLLCSGYDMGTELEAMGPHVQALTKPFEVDALERLLQQMAAALRGAA